MPYNKFYIPLNELQVLLVDKDSGEALANGTITSYKDAARTELKPLYTLIGKYGYYDYAALSNPLVLSSTGSIVDESGADIVPYAYPYNAESGDELYYLVVKNEDGVEQFTRQAFPWNPYVTSPVLEQADNVNYAKNGQFYDLNPDLVKDVIYSVAKTSSSINSLYEVNLLNNLDISLPKGLYPITKIIRNNDVDTDTFGVYTFSEEPLDGEPDGFAANYLHYESEATGASAETQKDIQLNIDSCNSFAKKTLTISIQASSSMGSSVRIYIEQGYNLVDIIRTYCTAPVQLDLTDKFIKYYVQITVPALNTSYEINEYNYFAVGISLPLNTECSINITNIQVNDSLEQLSYSYEGDAAISALNSARMISSLPSVGAAANLYYYKGYNDVSYNSPIVKRDPLAPSNIISYWDNVIPAGIEMLWSLPSSMVPDGFLIQDGSLIPAYKYHKLYSLYTNIFTTPPIYGYGSTTSATLVADTLTVTNNLNGLVAGPINAISGLVVTPIQVGDASHALQYTIQVTTGGALIDTSHTLKVYSTANSIWGQKEFVIRFVVDSMLNEEISAENTIFDTSTIFVYIKSSWSKFQIANALLKVFNPLCFPLCDKRGLFVRGVNGGRADGYMDPDVSSRINRGDGVTGDNVGTTQADMFASHTHDLRYGGEPGSGPRIIYNNYNAVYDVAPGALSTGGNETRPNNIYVYYIIKT